MRGLTLILIFFSITCFAQNLELNTKHFSMANGLPSNTIYSIISDKSGYTWIGTDAGVCRFDGHEFTNFTKADGLSSNDVFDIFCDSKNRVWFITFSNALSYYYRGVVHTQLNDPVLKKMHFNNRIQNLQEDANGCIYIHENRQNFYILKDTNFRKIEDLNIISNDFVQTREHKKNIYCITNIGPNMELGNNKFKLFDATKNKTTKITNSFIIADSIVYIQDGSKIIRENLNSFLNRASNYHYTFSKTQQDLYNIDSEFLYQIADNKVWVINKGTLIRKEKSLLENKNITSIYLDKNNNTYFLTLTNGFYLVKNNNSLKISTAWNENVEKNTIYKLKDNMLVGTKFNEIVMYNTIKRSSLSTFAMPKTQNQTYNRISKIDTINNKIILGSDHEILITDSNLNNQIRLSTTSTENFFGAFKDFALSNNKLYIGTHSKFLETDINFSKIKEVKTPAMAVCNFRNKIYTANLNELYIYLQDTLVKLPCALPRQMRIVKLVNNSDKELLILTAEDGLYKYRDNKILKINVTLSSNNCQNAFVYQHKIYLATKKGVSIIDEQQQKVQFIYEPDGLASNNVNDLTIDKDTLYAATEKGTSIIDLKSLRPPTFGNYFINPTIIGKDTIWDAGVTETYNDVPIKFILNSVSINTDGKLLHYYRIKEIDTTWALTENKFIDCSNLKPGNYTLETYAQNSYNVSSKVLTQKFRVKPYFLQRKLVQALLALASIFGVLFLYKHTNRKRINRQKEEQDMQNKIAALELASWRAKINPHFIFNAFNAMQKLFITKNFEVANVYLVNFSKVLRRTINHSGEILTTIDDEVNYIQSYLRLEKIKRNELLKYQVSIQPESIGKLYIPSMMLQPIIENALKHGIKENTNGIITIAFSILENKVYCRITDNGIGYLEQNMQDVNSKGILLIKEKIEIIERLIKLPIVFKTNNYYTGENVILGVETIFTFPVLTENIMLHESHNN
jgi:hypothetical protein